MTHGFYVAMGGIVIQMPDDNENVNDSEKRILNFFPAKSLDRKARKVLTLTPEGVEFLITKAGNIAHLIPEIPEDHIKDKSKGSGFAKTLVCMQGKLQSVFVPLIV